MRDPNRLDKFYDEMKEIHKEAFPDWRFLQFMSNFMGWIYTKHNRDPFFIEEDKCIELINEYAKTNSKLGYLSEIQ